jgi:hypothetical protein
LLGIPSGGFHSEMGPPTGQTAPKRNWLHPPHSIAEQIKGENRSEGKKAVDGKGGDFRQ